ncbi:diacylglycerol kinase family protein [Aerococcaceae bacterium DSM 111022]|nr:diacylglycerol kinase family protein [Aerococcaceae bacterium DSM 111022]
MKKAIERFIKAFECAVNGLIYAIKKERNLQYHMIAAAFVTLAGFFFGLNVYEWSIIVLLFGVVMSTEIINTAIETTVDLVTEEYHPLAKIAKDAAAAAVLVTAIAAVIIGLIIFVPKILQWII